MLVARKWNQASSTSPPTVAGVGMNGFPRTSTRRNRPASARAASRPIGTSLICSGGQIYTAHGRLWC